MATFVKIAKALKFPKVIDTFPKQGAFWKTLKKAATSYARITPNTGNGRPGGQIDVANTTGLTALRAGGRKV